MHITCGCLAACVAAAQQGGILGSGMFDEHAMSNIHAYITKVRAVLQTKQMYDNVSL